MNLNVTVVIEADEDGYYAYCPELEGCQSQGDTLEEAQNNIREAVSLYLSTLTETEKQKLKQRRLFTTTWSVMVA
jgi:predicted RNase H-like HicB family nuclease